VLPPDDLWADLKDSLEQRKQLVLPVAGVHPEPDVLVGRPPSFRWHGRARLAAAAVVLIAVSSGITAIVLQSRFEKQVAQMRRDTTAPNFRVPTSVMLPASFRHAEGEYNRAIDELAEAVDAQRGRLNPETIQTVDRSLAVIDSAIAEARAALVADPSNTTLVDLLSASYQRKLDLLRRTSELSSRT
jgi:hypothetical protein